jgi:hypothetical protein
VYLDDDPDQPPVPLSDLFAPTADGRHRDRPALPSRQARHGSDTVDGRMTVIVRVALVGFVLLLVLASYLLLTQPKDVVYAPTPSVSPISGPSVAG